MKKESEDPERESTVAALKRRHETRVPAAILVEVSGFDHLGHFFAEHTATTNVSENGCCFRLKTPVSFESLLAIQPVTTGQDSSARPVLYQIAWMEPVDIGAVIGVARLHGESTWCVAFPAANDSQTPKA